MDGELLVTNDSFPIGKQNESCARAAIVDGVSMAILRPDVMQKKPSYVTELL
jgi:hypothetical protein